MMDFGAFHFLRPAWLLALLPGAAIAWGAWRRDDLARAWQGVIEPHLLEALLLPASGQRGRLRPSRLLAACLLLASLALAGPTWEKEPTPFARDEAAVFLVVKVTPSMLAEDIGPSRLGRSVQKIGDFLDLRPGQRTGLIAYAGSAHLAMPLTSDPDIVRTFAAAFAPEVMPVPGEDAPGAVALADRRLQEAGVPGSIVLVADDLVPTDVEALRAHRAAGGAAVHVFAVAAGPGVVPPFGSPPAPPLDEERMRAAARAAGGAFVGVTPDGSDVAALSDAVERSLRSAPAQEGERWQDMGWWLLPLLALLVLPFFRRGGAVVLE
jgi:Ca-activated chloride channel family protein